MIRLIYFEIFILSLASTACKSSSNEILPEIKNEKTVMVYMSANNSLIDFAYTNINEMEAGISDLTKGTILVYAKFKHEAPCIYKITHDGSNEIKSEVVKQYSPHNSSDPDVMKTVFDDMKVIAPAKSYGLILWSHATGWMPANYNGPKLRSFGDDNGSDIDILELEKVIPNNLDYLMFDACSMSSIEVLYQLKDKAQYIIASPAEVLGNGMPYRKIVNDLLSTSSEQTLINIADEYYNHYNNQPYPYQSATITIIKSSELERFALETKELLHNNVPIHHDFNRDHLQRMNLDPINSLHTVFDFSDFIFQNFQKEKYSQWHSSLQNLVIHKRNTNTFTDSQLVTRNININGGIACYIPHQDNSNIHPYYKKLRWYSEGGFDKLF